MQKAKQDYFKDRSLYYSSFAIREQARKGSTDMPWDYRLSPVYVVGILNFRMEGSSSSSDKAITKVNLKDDENRDFSDKLNFIFLEMPNFRKEEGELETFIDKWLYVIKNLCRLADKPATLTEGIFKKLFSVAEIAAFTKEERYDYEESLKNSRDMYNTLISAKNEGLAEGEAIGLEKGEAIGSKKKAIEMAKSFKSQGVDYLVIAKASGLRVDEIERL